MSNIHTLNLSHLPEALLVHIALYENVKNAAFLHQQLLQGNSDFEYALIDASIVRILQSCALVVGSSFETPRFSPLPTSWRPFSGQRTIIC